MDLKERSLSNYKLRQAEAWKAFFDVSNFRIKNESEHWFPVHTTSVYGSQTPADAVLIVGDNFRAAAEAAKYLQVQNHNFGKYPEVVCIKGFSIPKTISYGASQQYWLKLILLEMGIPGDVVAQHDLSEIGEPIEILQEFFGRNEHLHKIVIFSSRGYSLSVAQQIFMHIPDKNWVFYENKYVEPKDRIFEAEIIGPEGFMVDMLIRQKIYALQNVGTERYPLNLTARANLPKNESIIKFLEKGYALGMETYHDWEHFNYDVRQGVELFEARRDDFKWMMLPENARHRILAQIHQLMQQYGEEIEI